MFPVQVFRRFSNVCKLQKCAKNLACSFPSTPRCATNIKLSTRSVIHYKKSTIFALSTLSGVSAVAIIRVSGPNADDVLYQMGRFKTLPPPRKAILRNVRDPETGVMLDKALLLWFPAPNSFTGEDVCELHVHGGTAVVRSVLNALSKLSGFVHAAPGEFTKRAFIQGKLDLTEVEGLADLLHAETEAQQQQALRQMEGALFKLYSSWTERIKQSLANLEAYIDFSEDQNLESHILDGVAAEVVRTGNEMREHLADDYRGERLRSGINSVLVGKPNVGKSSLLNAICQRDVAIVAASAGTTRDVIESCINLGGYLVHLSDTAGIRESTDAVEKEGVDRARKKSGDADILLFLMEAKVAASMVNCEVPSTDAVHYLLEKELGITFVGISQNSLSVNRVSDKDPLFERKKVSILLILNKSDLLTDAEKSAVEMLVAANHSIIPVSCLTGAGMDIFMNAFSSKVRDMCSFPRGEEPVITQERHRKCIENCVRSLQEYSEFSERDVVIAAEKLRNALTELGKITGKVKCDDILDIIFKDFCIGK